MTLYAKSVIAAGLVGGQYMVRAVFTHGFSASTYVLVGYVLFAMLCIAILPLLPEQTYFINNGEKIKLKSKAPWAGPVLGWIFLLILVSSDVMRWMRWLRWLE